MYSVKYFQIKEGSDKHISMDHQYVSTPEHLYGSMIKKKL